MIVGPLGVLTQPIRNFLLFQVLLSFGKNGKESNKENEQYPDYPSDNDSPIKGYENMARMGQAPKDGNDKWDFFKSMGSFLSNSFYW